jgi:hypothetical protein
LEINSSLATLVSFAYHSLYFFACIGFPKSPHSTRQFIGSNTLIFWIQGLETFSSFLDLKVVQGLMCLVNNQLSANVCTVTNQVHAGLTNHRHFE